MKGKIKIKQYIFYFLPFYSSKTLFLKDIYFLSDTGTFEDHTVNIRRVDNLIIGEGNIDIRESTEFEG